MKLSSSLPAAKDSIYPSGHEFSSGIGRRTKVPPLRSISTRLASIRNSLGILTAWEPPEMNTVVFTYRYTYILKYDPTSPFLTTKHGQLNVQTMNAISYTAARENLASTMNKVCEDHAPIIITRNRDQAVVMMSLEDYESLEETAYLLRNPKNAKRIMSAVSQLDAGKGVKRAVDLDA